MGKHLADTNGTIWFKNQRVWRTLLSGALSLLSVVPTVLLILHEQWPAEVWTVAAAQILAVQAVVTRVMAIEEVNRFLTLLGLGSAPKGA